MTWKYFPHHWSFMRRIHTHKDITGPLCGDSTLTKGPVMQSFDTFFVDNSKKLLNKRLHYRWFATPYGSESRCNWFSLTMHLKKVLLITSSLAAIDRSCGMNNLTHWDRDKMAAVLQTVLSDSFPRMKTCCIFSNFTEICSQRPN